MKRLILLLLPVVFLLLGIPARAAGQKTGSICVRLAYAQSPESPGSLTLFRVGRLCEEYFVPEGIFTAAWEAYQNLSAAEFAGTLAELAVREATTGFTKAVSPNGEVVFQDLEPGIYLVDQREAASGYKKINPFLVTVPPSGGQVDASPKVQIQEKEDSSLPYTGQTVLPGIAMLCLGGALVAIGRRLQKGM